MYPQYIKVAIGELRKGIIRGELNLEEWEYRKARYEGPGDYNFLEEWRPIRTGEVWGKVDTTAFFQRRVSVPRECAGKTLALEILLNGEGVLKVNGEYYHGIDRNRSIIPLADPARGGEEYLFEIEVVGQFRPYDFAQEVREPEKEFVFSKARLVSIEKECEALWFDLAVGWEAANALPEGDLRAALEKILYETVLLLDLRDLDSPSFMASVRKARSFYRAALSEVDFGLSGGRFHLIGHSHIDVAWLWQLKETVRKCSRTFSTALTLMRIYPHYYFTQSQAQLYEYTKEHYPQIYRGIKERVAAGQWEPTGSTWVEMDCNIPCGESLVRQFLYGKRFFMEEFGVETRVLWLPDVFGYTWSLPQIMKKAGVNYFLTNKIRWNDTNHFPYSHFWWEGIDGSKVLAHIPPTSNYNGNVTPGQIKGIWDALRPREGPRDIIYSYGFGDGGGGVTREMLEYASRLENLPGIPRCKTGRVQEFFEALEREGREDLPVWNGELYFELHRGTYTTQSRTKRFNRKSEILYREAEMWSLLSSRIMGDVRKYPVEVLRDGWKTILLHQFHDILPGSSIGAVYADAMREYTRIRDAGVRTLRSALESISSMVEVKGDEGIPVIVFNPLSWRRSDVVEIDLGEIAKAMGIEPGLADKWPSGDGSRFPLKVVEEFEGGKREVPWQFGVETVSEDRSFAREYVAGEGGIARAEGDSTPRRIVFLATDVPSLGYKTFWIIPLIPSASSKGDLAGKGKGENPSEGTFSLSPSQGGAVITTGGEKGWPLLVEDEHRRITFQDGHIIGIYDKVKGRDVTTPGKRAGELQSFEDRPVRYDAWDIDPYYVDKPLDSAQILSVEVLENGPVRTVIRFEKRLGKSSFTQDMVLYRHTRRIDFITRAEWREKRTLLKVAFPVEVRSTRATYEIAYGAIERPTHSNTSWDRAQFEVCGHKWGDLSEGDYGVSLLNDCKYGYDIKGNIMRLSLLRSPVDPDAHADEGSHLFTYSLYPHQHDWRGGGTLQEAYMLNQPLHYVFKEEMKEERGAAMGGGLPPEFSFAALNQKNVLLEVMKEAEDGDGVIIRLFEAYGQRGPVELKLAQPIKSAEECDLLERKMAEVEFEGDSLQFEVKPWEIRTFRVKCKPYSGS